MRISGIHVNHDANLCHFSNGICDYYEDLSRTFRIKHVGLSPYGACSSNNKVLNRILLFVEHYNSDIVALTFNPSSYEEFQISIKQLSCIFFALQDLCAYDVWSSLRMKGYFSVTDSLIIVEHSRAHIMSALSTFDDYESHDSILAISLDGWSTFTWDLVGHVQNNDFFSTNWKSSVFKYGGSFYDEYLSRLYIGEQSLSSPGKLMGMASHGKVRLEIVEWIEEYWESFIFKEKLSDHTQLIKNIESLVVETRSAFAALSKASGIRQSYSTNCLDFYASAQEVFKSSFCKTVDQLVSNFNPSSIVISGGCGLSIVTNSKLRKQLSKDIQLYIPPFCDDSGQSYGSAVFVHQLKGKTAKLHPSFPYIGCNEPETGIKKADYIELSTFDIDRIAELLESGKVVGIYEGDHAVGPRALGNRSVLANPLISGMKDKINAQIKHREWYRPYGAISTVNCLEQCFDDIFPSPYMLFEFPVKKAYRKMLSECLSASDSCRIQTVKKEQHKLLFGILEQFGCLSGYEILINTSFNTRGRPIVNSSHDAYQEFVEMGLDAALINGELFEVKN